MLAKKPEDITYSDLKNFLAAQEREGQYLDYKQAVSDKKDGVTKAIAAMANTHGGWIFFGVEEVTKDNQGRGLPGSAVGIDASTQPGRSVLNMCLSKISPPVIPEIATVEIEQTKTAANPEGKVVVIVRVHESDSTPHALLPDGQVYIRVSDVSHPYEDGRLALVPEIEMLLNRRNKSVELRESLIQRAYDKYRQPVNYPILELSCVPTVPHEPIASFAELQSFPLEMKKQTWLLDYLARYATVHEGVVSHFVAPWEVGSGNMSVFEVNAYGLVIFQSMILNQKSAFTLLHALYSFVQILRSFYKRVNFSGLCNLSIGIRGDARTVNLMLSETEQSSQSCLEQEFAIEKRLLVGALDEDETILDLFRQFLWSTGFGPTALTSNTPAELLNRIKQEYGKLRQ